MAVITQDKKDIVNEIKQKLDNARVSVFVNFSGLSVAELTQLRASLRKAGSEFKVYKNTFLKIALDEAGVECPEEFLFGPSSLVSTEVDAVELTKAVVKFAKTSEALQIKGGILDKKPIGSDVVQTLSTLPSRDELIAKVVGTLKAPLSRLVATLSSPTTGFVLVLKSIQEKKSAEGN